MPAPLPGRVRLALAGCCLIALGWTASGFQEAPARRVPPPARDVTSTGATAAATGTSATAVLAGGCFWGVQGVFQHLAGVTSAVSGYAGGERATAQYEHVGTGRTGHAETVRVVFDPKRISYGVLLQVFFSVAHDPTQRNRQGPDEGPQYRSTIFPVNAEQAAVAREYIRQLNAAHVFQAPIATTIEEGAAFYPAEDYHQDFLTRHPDHPYIVVNDLPKLGELKRLFPELYRAEPVLVSSRR